MNNKFLKLITVVSFFLTILPLTACNNTPTENDQATTDTADSIDIVAPANGDSSFVMAISGNPMATNPIIVGDRFGLTTVNMIYSPLARINANNEFQFELAQSMDISEDGLTMTVNLREGVLWSDGEPFTADDVVFTYNIRADRANGNYAGMWINDEVIEVEAIDALTVEFRLPEVSAAVLNNLLFEVNIMPEHIFADEPDFSVNDLQAHPVGTGPYRLVTYNRDQYLLFEANEHYFGGTPNIQHITLRIIENMDTQRMALQSGEIDAAVIFPADIETLDANAITAFPFSENRVGYIGMNTLTDELSDVRVRQAIRYALNTHDMNLVGFMSDEFFNTPLSILPPNNPWAITDVNTFETNLDRARELLAEAGVTDLRINFGFTSTDPIQTFQATLAQAQLAEIGITVELEGQDGIALSTELNTDGSTRFNLFTGGYIMGNDPDAYGSLFRSDGSFNIFNYSNDLVDQLFADAAVEMDESVRHELYAEIQRLIAEDAFFVPVVDNLRIIAVNNRIGGVEAAGLIPIFTFQDMSLLYIR